jgi:hypothetical protein
MYKVITKCRICGNSNLVPVLSLGNLALTGVFPKTPDQHVDSGPVDLIKCDQTTGCGLVQLLQSYDVNKMYGENYGYRSGLNSSMVRHLNQKVEKILAFDTLKEKDLIIDIGSNDGTTLNAYPKGMYELVGVDPTGEKFKAYYSEEIRLIPDFFSKTILDKTTNGKKAKIITSFSMFYDLENPVEFAEEIEKTLDEDGLWVMEQSYLPTMVKTNSFDTICHEHLEFYALSQIDWICNKVGLKIIDVEFNDVNGGSFSVVIAKINSKHEPNLEKIIKILKDERENGLSSTKALNDFNMRLQDCRNELLAFLEKAKAKNEIVCGLGASTKGNVLLQFLGINETQIKFIGDVNPDKHGSYTPGSKIPIIPEEEVLRQNPDYLLVLPWHFREFFIKAKTFRGRRLVFPLPSLEIVNLND